MVLGGGLALIALGCAVLLPLHYSERAALVFIGAPVGAVIGAAIAGRDTWRGAVLWLIGLAATIAFGFLLVAGLGVGR